jgi:alkylhydroperoxidase family enzyme
MRRSPQRPTRLALAVALALGATAPARAGDGDGPAPVDAIAVLEKVWPEHPESVAMLVDILQGSHLSASDGWFRKAVAHSRYDWDGARGRFDRDDDGRIARDEFPGPDADFARLDRDGDGALTAPDFDFAASALARTPGTMLFYRADADGDGKLTAEEVAAYFDRADRDHAGFLSLGDAQDLLDPRPAPAGRRDEAPPPPRSLWESLGVRRDPELGPSKLTLLKGLFTQEIGSLQAGPAVGERAPDFALRSLDGEAVRLADLIGPKPVVLVFGNFTCGPFRGQAGNVEKVYRAYKDRATFVMVYVREAHPTDGWSMSDGEPGGVAVRQPRSDDERREVARACAARLDFGFPMLVDTTHDEVGGRYSGMPSRLYVIDRDGVIAYKSGRGPFGFKPREMEQSLLMVLSEGAGEPAAAAGGGASEAQARVPLLDNEDAWGRLPVEHDGPTPTLPNWARALARTLPGTTAAMLQLDHRHRDASPLDPALRARIRWVAAHSNRSPYALAYAEADLRRAGLSADAVDALRAGDHSALPEPERLALEFARKMTESADTVTDEEVADLLARFGERKVVAMVQLLAYSNFQDRLLLTLNIPLETTGPLPPPEVRLLADAKPEVPDRSPPPGGVALPPAPERVDDPEWAELDVAEIRGRLEGQKANASRIRVPTLEEVVAGLPPSVPKPARPIRIQWSLVCMGYQPELAAGWSACTGAYGREARPDRVFDESLFWVVTRTIHCFY